MRMGCSVFGATITPYVGSDYYHPGPLSEADRQAVNPWIRAAGHFDAVIDFDAVVRDPQHPDRLLPAYDCGIICILRRRGIRRWARRFR